MGKEIMDEISNNPNSFRMGDIFLKIQEKVQKNFRSVENDIKLTAKELAQKTERMRTLGFNNKYNRDELESEESSTSAKRENELKFEIAERLNQKIKENPSYALNN